jgi:hypothetical protein
MQAMNGSIVSGGRRRLIGIAVAVVALSAMVMPSIASAKPPPITKTYLALGDSLTFGYSSQVYNEFESKSDPAQAFEAGFTNDYLTQIKGKTIGEQLTNNGCPGETTESLIGNNPSIIGTLNFALKGKIPVPVTGESPCAYAYGFIATGKTPGKGGPLHHEYGAGGSNFEVGGHTVIPNVASQLESAIKLIKEDKEAGKEVTDVSLNAGANDELHVLGKVTAEAEAEVFAKVEQAADERCATEFGGPGTQAEKEAAGETVCDNVEPDPTGHPGLKLEELREAEYAAPEKSGGHGYQLAKEGEEKATEKVKASLPGLFAQIDTNIVAITVALRDAESLGFGGVNYLGKITFVGNYNPFGKQFVTAIEGVGFAQTADAQEPFKAEGKAPWASDSGRCVEHAEKESEEEAAIGGGCQAAALHIGFTGIAALLAGVEFETLHGNPAPTPPALGVCMTDPLVRFDPGTDGGKKPALEAERLKLWTNMTNSTHVGNKANGPDIHPTPAGYKEMSKEMYLEAKKCHTENQANIAKGIAFETERGEAESKGETARAKEDGEHAQEEFARGPLGF